MIRTLIAAVVAAAAAVSVSAAPQSAATVRNLKPVQGIALPRRSPSLPGFLAARRPPAGPLVLTRAAYLEKMRAQHRTKDWNEDGVVTWQGSNPTENYGSQKSCVIVDYKFTPASTVKDKTKPGQFINTPASHTPIDWRSFLEVLAVTKFEGGECEVIGLVDVATCTIGGKTFKLGEIYPPTPNCIKVAPGICIPLKQQTPYSDVEKPVKCLLNPLNPACGYTGAKLCVDKGGTIGTYSKMQGCEKYQTFGPDSEAAFLQVAGINFDAEDWNKDGKITGKEGEFLCNR